MPSIAMPPLFRKYRREIVIAFLLQTQSATSKEPTESAALEFWRAEDQSNDQAFIHLLDRIIESRLQNLRIFQPRFEGFLG
jgi:hypothetical protein